MTSFDLRSKTEFGTEVLVAKVYIGTAGWAIPPQSRDLFTGEGSNLEKYSRFLNAAEINSSFYRDHRPETYEKWAESVPSDFRFSVKLNKYFTREKRLTETGSQLQETLEGIFHLGDKLGSLLIQIPGSLQFEMKTADKFFGAIRHLYDGEIVFEPRNKTWASEDAAIVLAGYGINKVLADPEPCYMPKKFRPLVEFVTYFRLHGSPEIYKSRYPIEILERVAHRIQQVSSMGGEVWCIFDNTTFGHALENALELNYLLDRVSVPRIRTEKSFNLP
jgi:uncharacterized protein YecE (DUF72 family)